MAVRKPVLVLFSCFCIMRLVKHTNGEATPPWITLLGCFDTEYGSPSKMFAGYSPTNCFKECKNFTYVGMQDNNCICSKLFQNITDVKNAALRSDTQCKRGNTGYMFLYSKVTTLPNTINQDADYGYVYVNISSSSSHEFHASKESQDQHGFICYVISDGTCYIAIEYFHFKKKEQEELEKEFFSKACRYHTSNIDRMNSTLAWKECNLVCYFDFDSCLNSFVLERGVFWIGMYRDPPDIISTSQTLLTKTSPAASSSSPMTVSQFLTNTNTPSTELMSTPMLPSFTSLTMDSAPPTGSPLHAENMTSKAMLEDTWKDIAIVFIVVSGVLLVVIPMLIVFFRLKKDTHIRQSDEEKMLEHRKTSTSTHSLKGVPPPAEPSNDIRGNQTLGEPSKPFLPALTIFPTLTGICEQKPSGQKSRRHKKRRKKHRQHSHHPDQEEVEKEEEDPNKEHKKKKRKEKKKKKRQTDTTEENAS